MVCHIRNFCTSNVPREGAKCGPGCADRRRPGLRTSFAAHPALTLLNMWHFDPDNRNHRMVALKVEAFANFAQAFAAAAGLGMASWLLKAPDNDIVINSFAYVAAVCMTLSLLLSLLGLWSVFEEMNET